MKKIEYRNQALKILPWVCANCGRDFTGKKLRELTVHHKDHNYRNNPPDGSNWELLCIYCHDNEHSRDLDAEWLPTEDSDKEKKPTVTHAPFAGLAGLMRSHDRDKGEDGTGD
jgi:5-methylcytosine-specific restriction endonuclease McrA